MKKLFCLLLVVTGVIAGCSNSSSDFDSDLKRLDDTLKKPIGSTDYYIMKRAFGYGEPSPVILIFGYGDDLATCQALLGVMKHDAENFGDPELQETMYFCNPAK